jgi:hypothetical protein
MVSSVFRLVLQIILVHTNYHAFSAVGATQFSPARERWVTVCAKRTSTCAALPAQAFRLSCNRRMSIEPQFLFPRFPKVELQNWLVLALSPTTNPCYHYPFLYDDKDVTISSHFGQPRGTEGLLRPAKVPRSSLDPRSRREKVSVAQTLLPAQRYEGPACRCQAATSTESKGHPIATV